MKAVGLDGNVGPDTRVALEAHVAIADRFYITTPIYYVNGRPHIGHAYTTIAADTAARWHRLLGVPTRMVTGTDEHGQKVLEKANERGMTPQAHCDDMVVHWKAMMSDLGIAYDHFVRTTDADHITRVQTVLQHLYDRDLIYKDSYEGWYSQSAERFWTEKDLVDGKCPDTGQPVTKIEESNWFFKMGSYQQELLDYLEAHPDVVKPTSRRNEVLGFLRKPLADLCISRPKSRMSWGIEIPFDTDYVTYVWFDALLNYLTNIGYTPGDTAHEAWWPANVQLIGKDILTTHAVYWSTMLLALGLPLPKTLFAHGWWMSADGAKMSKSLGNTIDINLLIKAYGVDAVRYFFLREISFGADGQFSYDGFLARYNTDLANDLGNLAHRGLSMTTNWLNAETPEMGDLTEDDLVLHTLADEAVAAFQSGLGSMNFQAAFMALFQLISAGNKYIDAQKPWALNKAGETARLKTVLRHILEIGHVAACCLLPVMPAKSMEMLTKLGRTEEEASALLRRWVKATSEGETVGLGHLTAGASLQVGDPLFPRHRKQPAEIAALFEVPADEAKSEEPKLSRRERKRLAHKAKQKPQVAGVDDLITYEQFAKVALRVARVVEAAPHPDADKLLVLQVDVGEHGRRQIVAGIAKRFSPDELVGRNVVIVANLAPATLRGVESQGMLLAAGAKEVVDLVGVDAQPGEVVR